MTTGSLTKLGEMSTTSEKRTVCSKHKIAHQSHLFVMEVSSQLDSDNNLFKVVCFWGLVFVVLAISVML